MASLGQSVGGGGLFFIQSVSSGGSGVGGGSGSNSGGLLNGSLLAMQQLQQFGMDRKRKVGPIAFSIGDDQLDEDHRFLLKSLRQPHSSSPKVQLVGD